MKSRANRMLFPGRSRQQDGPPVAALGNEPRGIWPDPSSACAPRLPPSRDHPQQHRPAPRADSTARSYSLRCNLGNRRPPARMQFASGRRQTLFLRARWKTSVQEVGTQHPIPWLRSHLCFRADVTQGERRQGTSVEDTVRSTIAAQHSRSPCGHQPSKAHSMNTFRGWDDVLKYQSSRCLPRR